MNKRKLPKAIRRTTDELRQAAAEPGPNAGEQSSAHTMQQEQPNDVGAAAQSSVREREPIELTTMPLGNAPLAAAPTVTRTELTPLSRLPAPLEVNAVRRRSQAYSIVERHATYSAAGGIIPVPIANVASVTAIIVRMVKRLSSLYGVPFERDRARAIVVALAGGTMPTGLAAVTTSTLYDLVPGAGFIGLAVSSVAAVACTRNIGRIFVEHFEGGATLHDISIAKS
jgi:uncharacterized protein (DUF697 family)